MRAQDEVYVARAVGALPRRPAAVSTHPPPPRLTRAALDSRAVEADSPDPAPSHDALYDELLDRLMRGEAVDLAALRAAHPDFPSEWLARLEKMQRTMAGGGGSAERSAPETIGPYRVLETLGEGGMGMVYLAEHPYLQRRVALKVVRPELRYSGTTRARFEREALAVARLKPPHIVTGPDAGEARGVGGDAAVATLGDSDRQCDQLLGPHVERTRRKGTFVELGEPAVDVGDGLAQLARQWPQLVGDGSSVPAALVGGAVIVGCRVVGRGVAHVDQSRPLRRSARSAERRTLPASSRNGCDTNSNERGIL